MDTEKPDYERIAAEMRQEGYGDAITAAYLEELDQRTAKA